MNEIEFLRRLVGGLGVLTTADAKELQMLMEPVEPSVLLDQICSAYVANARQENKKIEASLAPKHL